MIERILLIAKHELLQTVVSRIFGFLILLPATAVLLGFFGAMASGGFFVLYDDADIDAPPPAVLAIADGTGALEVPTSKTYEDFEVTIERVPFEGARERAIEQGKDGPQFLFVVDEDALTAAEGRAVLYYKPKAAKNRKEVGYSARTWVRDARLRHAGLDPETVKQARSVDTTTVTMKPTTSTEEVLDLLETLLPFGVLLLMYMSATIGGNTLLTSTLKDRDNRVVEIMLGCVSPDELMIGKLLGHLGASTIIALAWGGPVIPLVLGTSIAAIVGPLQVAYIFLFFLVATMAYTTTMGAIGSAVSDIQHAQMLITPVAFGTIAAMVPAAYIATFPETKWAAVLSILPPFGAYAMPVRLCTEAGAPHWQVWLSLALATGTAVLMVAASGRIYRLGLLVRGSPPNFRTLMRWVFAG